MLHSGDNVQSVDSAPGFSPGDRTKWRRVTAESASTWAKLLSIKGKGTGYQSVDFATSSMNPRVCHSAKVYFPEGITLSAICLQVVQPTDPVEELSPAKS